jgi:signal transduction histidine kinase
VLSEDQLRATRLSARIITASDAERAASARALHDSAAQSLAALGFQLSAISHDIADPGLKERLESLRNVTAEVLDEVRLIGQTMYPQALENLGLGHALRGLRSEIVERHPDVNVSVAVDDSSMAKRLPLGVAAVLYHVAREGLMNAVRHGSAREIEVAVKVGQDNASLAVADDGIGFDVGAAEREANGMGLFGIRQRLALVDGKMTIKSGAGEGTRLLVTVPLTVAEAGQR